MLCDPDKSNLRPPCKMKLRDCSLTIHWPLLMPPPCLLVQCHSAPYGPFIRYISFCWTVLKWKSRLCPHGVQQVVSVNFWHTYTPVVKWSTVHLTFILTTLLDYKSRQVDFVQAFSQVDIDCNVYMKVPRGLLLMANVFTLTRSILPIATLTIMCWN